MEATAAPVLTLQELRNATELLEGEGVASGRLTAAALDARRPGTGADYPDDGPQTWLAYYGWLAAQCAAPPATNPRSLAAVQADAAADAPVVVPLAAGDVVAVQPKSAAALVLMRGLDAQWRAIGPQVAALLDQPDGAPAAVHSAVWGAVLESLSLRLWLWAATTGIGIPFDEAAPALTPPAWTATVTARDVAAIWRAFVQVNHEDLALLTQAMPWREDRGTTRTLEEVIAAIAQERGQPTRTVYCLESVRSLYLQALAAAQTADAARREAAARPGAA